MTMKAFGIVMSWFWRVSTGALLYVAWLDGTSWAVVVVIAYIYLQLELAAAAFRVLVRKLQ